MARPFMPLSLLLQVGGALYQAKQYDFLEQKRNSIRAHYPSSSSSEHQLVSWGYHLHIKRVEELSGKCEVR